MRSVLFPNKGIAYYRPIVRLLVIQLERKPKGSIVVKCVKIFKTEKALEIQPVRPTEVCDKL